MKTKKIGLALGGGAARGLAHIGVIKVFEKAGFKISYIVGTSMGALIGGLYAATKNIDFIEKMFLHIAEKFAYPRFHLSLHKNLLFKNQKEVENIISLPINGLDFDDLKIPFGVVATNAQNGEEIFIRSGKLVDAIRASTAIPYIFDPVNINGQVLIDGGFVNPVPVNRVKEMGSEFVVGVNVSSNWPDLSDIKNNKINLKNIVVYTYNALEYEIAISKLNNADLIIKPPVFEYKWNDFYYAEEIIKKGENEAEKHINFIRKSTHYPKPKKKPLEFFIDFITNSDY